MRLADGATINNVARLEKAEEIEKASEEAKEEIKNLPPVSEGNVVEDAADEKSEPETTEE
jgi:hypothetical protein